MSRSSDCAAKLRDLAINVGLVARVFADDSAEISLEHALGRYKGVGGDGGRGKSETLYESVVWFGISAFQRRVEDAAAEQLPQVRSARRLAMGAHASSGLIDDLSPPFEIERG